MHHTMTAAAPARTVARRRPAVAVKSDVKTGHDIAYVTRGHASGCAGAMAYYTRSGEPPGTWEGHGTATLGVSGTVQAEVAERLYQQGVGPGGEGVWSSMKRSLANLTKQGIDQLVVLVKTRLKRMQYRAGLIDGFLAKTGLDLTIRNLHN
jgi:TrwC relaxase